MCSWDFCGGIKRHIRMQMGWAVPRGAVPQMHARDEDPIIAAPNRLSFLRFQSRSKPMSANEALEREVAELMVSTLNLEITADAIDPEAPLYREGLGLDSIDILEMALVISKRYGFQLRADDGDNVRIFRSLRNLAQHIASHRVES
jgi:acyl carrier protein